MMRRMRGAGSCGRSGRAISSSSPSSPSGSPAKELSKLGELVTLDVCMEIMDLLYETEDTSLLFHAPYALAASTLVTAYVISVPKQRWEFPLLPWVKFVTSYDEDEIGEVVARILTHVLQPEGIKQKIDELFSP